MIEEKEQEGASEGEAHMCASPPPSLSLFSIYSVMSEKNERICFIIIFCIEAFDL